VPANWPGFSIAYRYRGTTYEISVDRQPASGAAAQLTIDGQVQKPGRNVIELVDDGGKHAVHLAWLAAATAEDIAASGNI
jgi:cellobiose phosphorylase